MRQQQIIACTILQATGTARPRAPHRHRRVVCCPPGAGLRNMHELSNLHACMNGRACMSGYSVYGEVSTCPASLIRDLPAASSSSWSSPPCHRWLGAPHHSLHARDWCPRFTSVDREVPPPTVRRHRDVRQLPTEVQRTPRARPDGGQPHLVSEALSRDAGSICDVVRAAAGRACVNPSATARVALHLCL